MRKERIKIECERNDLENFLFNCFNSISILESDNQKRSFSNSISKLLKTFNNPKAIKSDEIKKIAVVISKQQSLI
jgi:hypothetical protein